MSQQRTLPRGLENRKYHILLHKERSNDTNKEEDSSKSYQRRETLRDLTHKYTRNSTTINTSNTNETNESKVNNKSFRKTIIEKDLLSFKRRDERIDHDHHKVQSMTTLDTNKFFTDLSKEKTVALDNFENIHNKNGILKRTYSKIEIENYFENLYGKNGIKGMVVDFYDLESIKNEKLHVPEWLLRDNSEELFKAELPPQDITVHNLWFFRRKDEGSPDFVQKRTKPISNSDISSHLEKIYNSHEDRSVSKMIRIILDELRKVNNYMLYIGSETRYPNNVMEKTPKLIEKLGKVLERIRFYKNYDSFANIANDEKAIKYAKELLDVSWINFNVRTRDESKSRATFRKVWIQVDKELDEVIEKHFNKNKSART